MTFFRILMSDPLSLPKGPDIPSPCRRILGRLICLSTLLASSLLLSGQAGACDSEINVKQDGTRDFTTIQAAVNAVGTSLSGDTCVIIRDTQTYQEQVTIQNVNNNGYRLMVMSDPTFISSAPAVIPPDGSTAAFHILNDSVTIQSIRISSLSVSMWDAKVSYGILSSSALAVLDNILISFFSAQEAGISLTDRSLLTHSTLYGASLSTAVVVDGSSNTIIDTTMDGTYTGITVEPGSFGNRIARTDVRAWRDEIHLIGAASTMIETLILPTGNILISGSTDTVVEKSTIQVITMDGGGQSIRVDSNTICAYVHLEQGSGGILSLSSNTTTGQYSGTAFRILSPLPDARIFVTGNTLYSFAVNSKVGDDYSLYLDGISNGATIQHNSMVFRKQYSFLDSPSYGILGKAYVVYAANSSGLVIENNRFVHPDTYRGGNIETVHLNAVTNSEFRFNDVYVEVRGWYHNIWPVSKVDGYGIVLENGSSGFQMTNNTIATSIDTLASIPQPYASSATIVVSADSQPGFLSDYNSFYDFKDAESFSWGGSTYSGLAAWTAATGQDTHSFNALPLWKSTAQYTEDFHPLSATGRYDPVLDSFVLDPETSLTIDAGDPARDFALEPAPNGGRVNLGSYGNTVEASKSAPAPATSVLGGVFFTSATISYGAVSADGYRVDASTHSDFSSGIISSTTANTALTQLSVQGLSSNATYYFRAGATYGANHSFRNTVPFSSTTLANLPASPSSEVHTSSLAFYWGANGNAEDTPYLAQISTDDFSTVNLTTSVLAVSTTFQTLVPNTTYYLRVRAQARSGSFTDYAEAVPAITHAAAPSALMSSAHISSAALSWEVGANPAGTEYLAQISTDEFSTVNLSSRTLAASATFQALVPNTTYYLRVHAFNAAGIPTEDALASPVLTPAESPGGVVVVDVSSEALTVDWSGGANPVGTVYEAFTSTDDFATVNVSSRTLALSATFYGLAPYTTYYLRVSASNYGGVLSDLSAVESTRTWPAPPAAPGTPAGTALGVSSISWTWAAAPYAASYTVRPATDSATVIGSTAAPAYHQTGLAPNTTFSIVVAALNVSGSGPASSPSPAVYTLANPPSGLTTTAIHLTSASVQWGLNGNTAFTQAALERSTDSASFSSVFSGVAVDFTDTELSECSTYYFRARNQNGGGFLTDYSSVLSFMTESSTASPASALSAEALSGDRITLSWTPSVSANVAQYRLYYDAGTGTIDYGSALSVLSSTETHWTTGVLASSGAYKFALRAKNTCGYEETEGVFASVAATATLTEVRAAIRAPASGQHIKGNSVTFLAETLAGASADVRRVVFQYRPSGTQPWSDIPAANAENPNPDLLSPYFIQSDVDAWGAGAYDVRALAVDVAGSSDTAPSVITVTVEAFAADADINENLVSGKVEKAQEVSNAVTTTLYAAGGGTDDPAARLILPSGVLPVSTVTVTLACDPVIGTAAPAGYSFVGSAVRITLSGGLSSLNGAAQVTLSYPSTLADTSGLRMQSLNEATGQWSQLTGLTLDTARRTATAQTTHFSVFALVTGSQAAADLSHVRVYPVPYKPNGGNSDEGVPYAAGNTDSGIIFDNLPRSAEITVYTLSGRRVTKFSAESVSGRVQWDVRNDSGQAVASGGYLAVIRSPGMPEIVKKLLIIR